MSAPSLNDEFRLHQIVEQLDIETFITPPAIEGFIVSVFPWTSRFDVERLGADAGAPLPQRFRAELAANI